MSMTRLGWVLTVLGAGLAGGALALLAAATAALAVGATAPTPPCG
jgi:hypothetical protein